MANNINAKINLMKLNGTAIVKGKSGQDLLVIDIDKAKLFKGEKGVYVDLFMFGNDETDQFGNHYSIAKSKSKNEREAGVDTIYLGNGQIFNGGSNVSSEVQDSSGAEDTVSDDLPF